MWDLLKQIYAAVLAVGTVLIFLYCKRYWKEGLSPMMTLCFVMIIPLVLLNLGGERDHWKNLAFSGRIVLDEPSPKNREIHRYIIVSGDAAKLEVFDKFLQMRHFKIGDTVSKKSGETQVLPTAP